MTRWETWADHLIGSVRGWKWLIGLAVVLGVVSLLANVYLPVRGYDFEAIFLRSSKRAFSLLTNSGAVWAGLLVLGGWLVRRPFPAMIAGVGAGWLALGTHYLVAELFNLTGATFEGNELWFRATLYAGAPLALVGVAARRRDIWGSLAKMVVPIGFMLEPLVTGLWGQITHEALAIRYSSLGISLTFTAIGVVGVVWANRDREEPRFS